jgi:hypothetical protein
LALDFSPTHPLRLDVYPTVQFIASDEPVSTKILDDPRLSSRLQVTPREAAQALLIAAEADDVAALKKITFTTHHECQHDGIESATLLSRRYLIEKPVSGQIWKADIASTAADGILIMVKLSAKEAAVSSKRRRKYPI